MIRSLYTSPIGINWSYLEAQIRSQHPDLITINSVAGQVAAYFPSEITQEQQSSISNIVSNHNPMNATYPPLDAVGALATLLVVLELVPLVDASNAIGEEPDHLIAEATAWSVA